MADPVLGLQPLGGGRESSKGMDKGEAMVAEENTEFLTFSSGGSKRIGRGVT